MEKSEIKRKVLPAWPVGPKRVLNSLCKVDVTLVQIKEYREGMSQ